MYYRGQFGNFKIYGRKEFEISRFLMSFEIS
jgi:hypothetical protein